MSIGSIGVSGFDDDSGQSPWDDGGLAFVNTATITGSIPMPFIDCSRFGYTYAGGHSTDQPYQLVFGWSTALVGGILCGVRKFTIDNNIGSAAALSLPNLGPAVQLTTAAINPGTQYTPIVLVLLSNRPTPANGFGGDTTMMRQTFTLAAGGSQTVYSRAYFGGSVGISLFGGSQGVTLDCYELTALLAYVQFYQLIAPANQWVHSEITWPILATRVIATNTSGAVANNTAFASITPNIG